MTAGQRSEIRMKDLFSYFLRRWKSILAVTVLCAVTLGGWQYFCVKKAYDAGEKTKEEARYEEELNTYETNLANAQGDVNYLTEVWKGQVAYRDNSVLMNLDPNDVWVAERKYLVSGEDESAADILSAYTGAMTSEHDETKLMDAFGTDNAAFAKELVRITADKTANSFLVTVWGSEKEKAEKGLAYVCEKIEEIGKSAQGIGIHTLRMLNEGVSKSVIEDLPEKQRILGEKIADDEDSITRAKRSLRNVQESKPFEPGNPVVRWAVTGGVLGFLLIIAIYLTTFLNKRQ